MVPYRKGHSLALLSGVLKIEYLGYANVCSARSLMFLIPNLA